MGKWGGWESNTKVQIWGLKGKEVAWESSETDESEERWMARRWGWRGSGNLLRHSLLLTPPGRLWPGAAWMDGLSFFFRFPFLTYFTYLLTRQAWISRVISRVNTITQYFVTIRVLPIILVLIDLFLKLMPIVAYSIYCVHWCEWSWLKTINYTSSV